MRLIGDVPIYVAPGSADHRAHPELFQEGAVAGAPPDLFTDKGQLWGNPLYDWPALRRRRYRWWTERLRRTFELFDLARIDHFRGFVAYWAVPAGAPRRARRALGARPGARRVRRRAAPSSASCRVIAEDLGVITPAVRAAARRARASRAWWSCSSPSTPTTRTARTGPSTTTSTRSLYTGTHDNDTLRGWWETAARRAPRARREAGAAAAGVREREPWWALVRLALRLAGAAVRCCRPRTCSGWAARRG